MSFHDDRSFEARTLPLAQAALGVVFMRKGTPIEDMKRNTDLVLEVGGMTVCVRVRRHGAVKAWKGGPDVTYRWSRPSGTKTEGQKIIEGFGDFQFYAVANEPAYKNDECHLDHWVVIDLAAFRRQFNDTHGHQPVWETIHNRDGTEGRAFKTATMWPECIRAAYRWKLTPAQAEVARWVRAVPALCGMRHIEPRGELLADFTFSPDEFALAQSVLFGSRGGVA